MTPKQQVECIKRDREKLFKQSENEVKYFSIGVLIVLIAVGVYFFMR